LGGYAFWDDMNLNDVFTIHKAAGWYTYAYFANDYGQNFGTIRNTEPADFTDIIVMTTGANGDCMSPLDFVDDMV
jgi:hypothetical protein